MNSIYMCVCLSFLVIWRTYRKWKYVKYVDMYIFLLLFYLVKPLLLLLFLLPLDSTKDGWRGISIWFIFTSFCFDAFHNLFKRRFV